MHFHSVDSILKDQGAGQMHYLHVIRFIYRYIFERTVQINKIDKNYNR